LLTTHHAKEVGRPIGPGVSSTPGNDYNGDFGKCKCSGDIQSISASVVFKNRDRLTRSQRRRRDDLPPSPLAPG